MTPSDNGDRSRILLADNIKLRQEILDLKSDPKGGKKLPPSPTGTIDKRGLKDVGKAGVGVAAPAGAWAGEIVTLINEALADMWLLPTSVIELSIVQWTIGGVAGLCVGSFVATAYKILKDYQ